MPRKKQNSEKEESSLNTESHGVKILTSEEYEQIKKDRAKAEKMQYSFKTRFRASVLGFYISLPILIGILGFIPIISLLINDFKLLTFIIFVGWCVIAYIGFLSAKYFSIGDKELWLLVDMKDNPNKYKNHNE